MQTPQYYEDVRVGREFTSSSFKVTGSDIDNFARLTLDRNPLHLDAEFCKTTPFGRRIAHGLFGLSLIEGLKYRMGWFDGTALASLSWQVTFSAPIFIGDTLRVVWKVARKRTTRKPDRGILYEHIALVNQRDETVQRCRHTLLVRRAPR